MSNDRKVIPFRKKFKTHSVKTTPNDLRAAATGTLALILLLMVGFNFRVFESSPQVQANMPTSAQRGLASVPQVMEPQWKKSLSELGAKSIHAKAQKPSALDRLTYGYLQGNYAFTVDKGVVTNIRFSDSSEGNPQKMASGAQFIQQFSDVLVPQFVGISTSKREATSTGFKEIYNLKTQSSEKIIELDLDQNNGLLGVAVR
jgi:hypothetical protein